LKTREREDTTRLTVTHACQRQPIDLYAGTYYDTAVT